MMAGGPGGGSFSGGGVGQGRKPPAEWDLAEVMDWVTRLGREAQQERTCVPAVWLQTS